ncbi:zinc finger protein CONSTANS-LIKE 16-like [Dorcoceras hygrometricum]|uniref:Zinc finger protein CONSTANS-LIKE 16-like n=1 Tax=Dorcoceras hygrometricum TaxID=472368 RepID=A0A2Z7BGM9_9LAMI|nr:zinc finger protein CONSTANS-LIKE 16-like [Dorcoceras hygrometricum]
MASLFYSNSQHIDFDSVLAMDDQSMVSMFQALMASGHAGRVFAITLEKFSMVTAVVCGVRMNWASILFSILKKMLTPGSKQAKGFAVQISLLLENITNLELGESLEFPASKILTEKTVHRFVSLNDKVGAEEDAGAPKPKAASKKRQVVAAVGAPVAEPSADVETSVGESFKPVVEVPAEETRPSSADDVDFIIKQVIEDTALMGPAEENQEVDASADRDQPAATTEERHWFDLPYEDLMARFDAERQVVTASDTDEDIEQVDVFTDEEIEAERPDFETDVGNVQLQSVDEDQQVQFYVEEPSADEAMSLEDIMLSIPLNIPLPSAGMEVTKITMGKTIKIPGVDDRTLHLANLPKISADDKGKKILVEKDPVKGTLS